MEGQQALLETYDMNHPILIHKLKQVIKHQNLHVQITSMLPLNLVDMHMKSVAAMSSMSCCSYSNASAERKEDFPYFFVTLSPVPRSLLTPKLSQGVVTDLSTCSDLERNRDPLTTCLLL